jgi:hypothetical protein
VFIFLSLFGDLKPWLLLVKAPDQGRAESTERGGRS